MGALDGSDRLLAALAASRYGIVARSQLLAVGVTRRQIAGRLHAGRLHQMHRGVYAVGHRAKTAEAVWTAAVLAGRSGARLSHRSAAALWGLGADGDLPAVTTSRDLTTPGIEHHRARLPAADHATHRRIAVTSISRTLADIAPLLDDDALERAVREAQFTGRWDDDRIREVLTRRPSTRLRAYLGDVAPTQTRLEDRFLRMCDRHRIPRPRTQQGRRPRSSRTAPRRTPCSSKGSSFTWEDVTRRPALVAAQVRRALGLD